MKSVANGSGPNSAANSQPSAPVAESATIPATTEQTAERELRVEIWRNEWAQFTGSAAQLIAEGLIPEGFEWPQAAADKRWEANGFDYSLRRTRPDGHKGPMRSWLEMDNWVIRVDVTGRDWTWRARRKIEEKAEALRDEIYSQSPVGQRERSAEFRAYWKAHTDETYQAFKALIPGLVPPKRGRPAKGGGA